MNISYDNPLSVENIGMSGLNVSQYYDVQTDPTNPNFIYAGSQDQGYQPASTANGPVLSPVEFTQIVSGDYGHMQVSANGKRWW